MAEDVEGDLGIYKLSDRWQAAVRMLEDGHAKYRKLDKSFMTREYLKQFISSEQDIRIREFVSESIRSDGAKGMPLDIITELHLDWNIWELEAQTYRMMLLTGSVKFLPRYKSRRKNARVFRKAGFYVNRHSYFYWNISFTAILEGDGIVIDTSNDAYWKWVKPFANAKSSTKKKKTVKADDTASKPVRNKPGKVKK